MKYRLAKRPEWWTTLFDTGAVLFLCWDKDLEHFEVESYSTIHRHGYIYEFDDFEIKALKQDYPDLEKHFLIEETGRKKRYDK